jgi:hypothetical protein
MERLCECVIEEDEVAGVDLLSDLFNALRRYRAN